MTGQKIIAIAGRQILDSRGNPTVEVDVELNDGSKVELLSLLAHQPEI